MGFVRSQVRKFLQHLFRSPKIQGRLVIRILKSLARHDDPPVHLVLGVQEMHIAGGTYQFVKLCTQLHYLFIDLDQVVLGLYRTLLIPEHESVIAQGLYFQIIIEVHQPCDLRIRGTAKQGLIQLTRLTGGTDDKALPVLVKDALGDSGPSCIVLQVGPTHQAVQVDPPDIILGQDDHMIGGQLSDGGRIHGAQPIQAVQVRHRPIPEHFYKGSKYLCRGSCIIHCPVMVCQGNVQRLCHCVQLKTVQVGKQQPCDGHRIQDRGVKRQPLLFGKMADKSHIKPCIMGYKDRIPHKLQKSRQNHIDFWVRKHHCIIDARKFFYVKGNGHIRVYKG